MRKLVECFSIRKQITVLLAVTAVLFGRTAEAQSSTYTTNFPLTENPISESGRWINGQTTGIDWLNVRTSPGLAFGTGSSPSPPYNDPTALLAGSWGPVQTAEGTVVVAASPQNYQEVEMRLLSTITPHSIVGYEVLFSVTGNNYVDIVRWTGCNTSVSCFVYIVQGAHPSRPLRTGDRVKATVDAAGLISAYVDLGSGWVLVASGTDTTYRTGAPGIGFFANGGAPITGFGLSSFSASSTGGTPQPPAAPSNLRIIASAAQDGRLASLTPSGTGYQSIYPLSFAILRRGLAFHRVRGLRSPFSPHI